MLIDTGGYMTQEFLAFVDEKTECGKRFITSDELFKMFVEMKHLNPNTAFGFKLRLQKRGIL
jgi:hypothetical protein